MKRLLMAKIFHSVACADAGKRRAQGATGLAGLVASAVISGVSRYTVTDGFFSRSARPGIDQGFLVL